MGTRHGICTVLLVIVGLVSCGDAGRKNSTDPRGASPAQAVGLAGAGATDRRRDPSGVADAAYRLAPNAPIPALCTRWRTDLPIRRFVRFLAGVIAYRAPTDEVDRRNLQGLRAGPKPTEREVFPRPQRSTHGADGLPPCSWSWSSLSRALAFVTRFAYTIRCIRTKDRRGD